MKAALYIAAGQPLAIETIPDPEPGEGEVVLKVARCGVCGTDLHIWEWDAWAAGRLKPPVVIGHEFAGEIAELGVEAMATGLVAVGDKVTWTGRER